MLVPCVGFSMLVPFGSISGQPCRAEMFSKPILCGSLGVAWDRLGSPGITWDRLGSLVIAWDRLGFDGWVGMGWDSSSNNSKPEMWGWDGIMLALGLAWGWDMCLVIIVVVIIISLRCGDGMGY